MVSPEFAIVRARPQDCEALTPLFDAYRAFFAGNDDRERSQRFLEERLRRDDSVIFLGRRDAEVEGFVQLYPLWSSWHCRRIWFLSDLYVRESSRKLGLGSLLVERIVAYAAETDASSIMVELPLREPHLEIFYAKLGFRKDSIFELARRSF
jgi:GNAT superfamily N-acetyltransferase